MVNAAGIWGQRIAEYADLSVRMFPAKGSLLILDHRINNHVINMVIDAVVEDQQRAFRREHAHRQVRIFRYTLAPDPRRVDHHGGIQLAVLVVSVGCGCLIRSTTSTASCMPP